MFKAQTYPTPCVVWVDGPELARPWKWPQPLSALSQVGDRTLASRLKMDMSEFPVLSPYPLTTDHITHTHTHSTRKLSCLGSALRPSNRLAAPSCEVSPSVIVCESAPWIFQSWPSSPMLGMSCLHERRRGVIYSRWLTESLCALWHFNPLPLNSYAISIILCVF